MSVLSSQRHRSHIFFFGFFTVVTLLVVFLRIVIGPFILALVLAYVFNPSIEALERRGVKRSLIVVTAILTVV